MEHIEKLMDYSYEVICVIGEYMNEVRDHELKELLQKHLPYLLQAYNEQINFQECENVQHIIYQYPLLSSMEMIHTTYNGQKSDIEIAISYISYLKRLALEYAQVAIQVANPEFRSFLESCFLKMNRNAYSVWQYVVKKEYSIQEMIDEEKYG
ncbi:Coat F domain-containing protein [Bacillus sp. 491mf]|uniref:spore coat protein n=1 Tax=unclassified Bacillus (in: firmicutes) TaxID=185979 RepID=UPI00054D7CB0|nr:MULTISPECIES: spore coat protein [unclassified Bacillus (in: firmicutes)]SFC92778.1 Coat F domain-containing protein [Bacillus sp. 491mf]